MRNYICELTSLNTSEATFRHPESPPVAEVTIQREAWVDLGRPGHIEISISAWEVQK